MRITVTYVLLLITLLSFGSSSKVTRVIDGDTFEIESGEHVRLIGINAPEISDIFGQEAKQYLSDLIENKTVDLKSDIISNDTDRYGRLLRYVIFNGVDINKKMISDGFAFAYLKYHFSNSIDYKQTQFLARESNIGIWGDNKQESIIFNKNNTEYSFWQELPLKVYLIGSLVLFLVIIGLYTYFKN